MNDKYGIKQLFPSVGLEWFNTWDNNQRRKLGKTVEQDPYDSRFSVTSGSPNSDITIIGDGSAQFRSSVPVSNIRLWVQGPWTNTEMTVFTKKIRLQRDIQLRSRSNHLQSGVPYQCVFGDYLVNYNGTDGNVNISCEPMHPIYKKYIIKKPFTDFPNNEYVGFKQVTRTVDNNKVKVEGYYNTGDKTLWSKLIEYTFDGTLQAPILTKEEEQYRQKCIDKGDKVANDLRKSMLWLKEGKYCWLRLNESTGWNMRYFSVREIAPLS